jgi:hypothetical protein
MNEGAASARRRRKIQEAITAGRLPRALAVEAPTWIPTAHVVGGGPPTCHYCGEAIGPDEALLVRDGQQCHPDCEEAWRDLVTGERGDDGA